MPLRLAGAGAVEAQPQAVSQHRVVTAVLMDSAATLRNLAAGCGGPGAAARRRRSRAGAATLGLPCDLPAEAGAATHTSDEISLAATAGRLTSAEVSPAPTAEELAEVPAESLTCC